ncbi:MAG: hypothetical protein ACE5Q3_17360 [Alphaproteobacteria bacterium]
MTEITITEALAELKTLQKRIAKKRQFVLQHLLRQERLKDPLEKEGGSVDAIKRERQAIADLNQRMIVIRTAITSANASNEITIGGETRTIEGWLVWRREVAPGHQDFLGQMNAHIQKVRNEARQKGLTVAAVNEVTKPDDVVVHINERELAEDIEGLEEILGSLDGQLSLKNATVTINV